MALYMIGDVQGCDDALARLLAQIGFSPSRDTVFLLGDLVNRGPQSAAVLRRLMALDGAARCLLGNHDLHLLAVAHGVRALHRGDTLSDILDAPDRDAMIDWLRRQNLALMHAGVLMVHAGVLPSWTAEATLARAGEVEAALRDTGLGTFLASMYGNQPAGWHESLAGADRLRVIVNALTRLRFCNAGDEMEFATKEGAEAAPAGYRAWFEVPGRRTADHTVAFGHWSTLGWINRPRLLSLDTGCVWGGCLTAVRFGGPDGDLERIEVKCEQARAPGSV